MVYILIMKVITHHLVSDFNMSGDNQNCDDSETDQIYEVAEVLNEESVQNIDIESVQNLGTRKRKSMNLYRRKSSNQNKDLERQKTKLVY